jgi:hypothetical protein
MRNFEQNCGKKSIHTFSVRYIVSENLAIDEIIKKNTTGPDRP